MGFHLPICELWNFVYCILYFIGKTSRQFMVESSPSWNHPLLYVRSTTTNGQQLIVDGFLFDDKAFFSRLAYYFTYIFFGPLYSLF